MATDLGSTREHEFEERLLASVREAMRHTRLNVIEILEDIQRIGGLQSAKNRLRAMDRAVPQFFSRPEKYFLATKRIGRLDLSIEALVLDPRWQALFTQEETDRAAATLADHGFNPTLEAPPGIKALTPIEREPSFSLILLGGSRTGLDLDDFSFLTGELTGCEVTANMASELRAGRHPWPRRLARKHLGECPQCRGRYPELTSAFQRFDEEAEIVWLALLTTFQATLELGDEQLKRFHLLQPEDYHEPGDYEVDLDVQLSESIRPICAWRAVRVGCQLGRFMNAFAGTFDEQGDLWLKWRSGEQQGPISTCVRGLDRGLFILGLLARNLLLIRSWPSEDEGILWAPTDGDLVPCPNLLRLEVTSDMGEWEQLLGKPPRGDLNLLGVLYLAHSAAASQLQQLKSEPQPGLGQELREEFDSLKEMLRAIQGSQAETLQRQDAIIDELARMVCQMESTDRHACEQSLRTELSNTYAKLTPQVRSLLQASEQMSRTPGFAAPGKIIDGLATAFELQLQHSVMAGLFDHLRGRKVKSLKIPETWQDPEQRPLWKSGEKADKCTIGTMRLLLLHPSSEIEEFFAQYGMDRLAIQEATEEVCRHRNPAVHGRSFDIGTANEIRSDWFSWKHRVGGIYSVFFRNSESQGA